MATKFADIATKLNIVDETEEAPRKRNRKIWLFVPLTMALVAGCAIVGVRRFRSA